MKTAIATITAGLLLLAGLAWAQMGPGMHSGMRHQQSAAGGSPAEATQETSKHSMQGSGGMMGSGMMGGMMGQRKSTSTQDDMPFIARLLQQREQLGLAPEQVQQLQALANEARKTLIRQEAEVQVTEMDLETLMQADPVVVTQVEDAVKRVEAQRTATRLTRLNAIVKAKALLTPEQRQQVPTQTAVTSQAMPNMMGCPMMSGMMGH
jgi:hypothetical protein